MPLARLNPKTFEVEVSGDINQFSEWLLDSEILAGTPMFRDIVCRNDRHVLVSTTFLGYDHQWEDNKEPLWFETMDVQYHKGKEDGEWCDDQRRYTTYAQARQGHREWMEQYGGPVPIGVVQTCKCPTCFRYRRFFSEAVVKVKREAREVKRAKHHANNKK